MSWESQQQAFDRYGFVPYEDAPDQGVGTLDLSYHVTRSLGLGAPGKKFSGRGFQAQANRKAVVELLEAGR
jgi:hypothetical protein